MARAFLVGGGGIGFPSASNANLPSVVSANDGIVLRLAVDHIDDRRFGKLIHRPCDSPALAMNGRRLRRNAAPETAGFSFGRGRRAPPSRPPPRLCRRRI